MKVTDIYLYAILASFIVIIGLSLWRFQRSDNEFNLLDLLMENGKVSRLAAAFSVTLVITSWIIIKLCVDGKMTEGYLVIYGGLWITPILTKMFATSQPSVKEP
ncbi:MAG: hypothetical protein B7Z31_00265 [Rhodobacterales bacterium 12-65-15]|nr:MAG: hypothetical protein B7Z31_00265 [Rhodobacterales bacterium 12-65-15]